MSVRAVIFDFDLTLADSSAAIVACTEYALHQLDAAGATPAQIAAVIGLPLHEMFRLLTGETEPARADAFARHFVVRADEIMVRGTRIYPEVPPLLARLREKGLAVAIVSSKFRYRIEAILALNQLQSLVDVLIGGEDVQRHKPDPEGSCWRWRGLVCPLVRRSTWATTRWTRRRPSAPAWRSSAR
ncbi:Phosphoglycolate phosphatase [Burkholderia cepacia]|nr:Phosphoglycolate phosphatase [Burkholderia cepacia]